VTEPAAREQVGRDRGPARVGWLTVALAASFAATFPLVASDRALHPVHFWGFFVITALFAAGELLLIHVPTRRDTHTVSFSDVPLILGLFLLPAAQFPLAAVIGTSLALRFHRKQRGVKLAFNVAEIGVQPVVAMLVFRSVAGHSALASPRTFAAAIAAALAADLLSAVLVSLAIGLFRGTRPELGAFEVVEGALASVAKAALALLAVSAVLYNSAAALTMAAVSATTMYLAFRAYALLHERHQRLDMLYRFTSAVGGSVQLDAIAETVVKEARDLLRTAHADLCVEMRPGTTITWRTDADGSVTRDRLTPVEGDSLWQRVVEDDTRVADDDHLAVALAMHSRARGYLSVRERLGPDAAFDAVDIRLFDALAHQAAIALENGGLVLQLEIEMREREHRATHDQLTGLVNRMCFSETLETALSAGDGPRALFVLGLDRFSEVNETLGHDNGDTVLCEVANRLRGAIEGTTVARLGGDEFAVLTSGPVSVDDLRTVGDQLVAAVTRRLTIDGLHLEAGMSIGVAMAPDHGTDAESLLRYADTAMRHAKSRRSGFEVHVSRGETDMRRRLALAHQLRQAIDGRELTVYYQPKIETVSGWSVGVEALVRWNHPQLGFLPPDEFIPIAEHTGFIEPLTTLALDTALAQRRTWADAGLELGIAVNVSARSLADRSLADRVTRALVRNRCPSDALTIEITESQLMADPDRAADALRELHGLGVRISIDDFGTGFSSFSSLRELPIDEVKIDKSFVFGVMNNESDAAIVRSITALGRNLGLHVTAEGVENRDSLEFVTACGAHAAQGYYFSKALPADELEAWIRDRLTAEIRS